MCQWRTTEHDMTLDECKDLLPQLNANTINYSPLPDSGECNVKACEDEEAARDSLEPYGSATFDVYFCDSEYYLCGFI